ncbi:MAG: hypothetical protein A3F16_02320 [Deltaproteobacteria bacterium RIFCSPHIGHO2_12_FULL_43_9]|nr:MAG: hypothetical protein A3F16_02320 [Deltaproteobacteria bacterium RIFCSPHIGHO2_12_FULL_43_9]
MRTPLFLLILIVLLTPSTSPAWIPETLDTYGDEQIEPSLRPAEELKMLGTERSPTSTPNTGSPDNDTFEFRQEHMKKILEKNY